MVTLKSELELRAKILKSLQNIEEAMRSLKIWSDDPQDMPADEALASTVPFCLDTMEFHQWLQYVFVPKMRKILEKEHPLPKDLKIHTVAEEYYRGKWQLYRELLIALRHLDALF